LRKPPKSSEEAAVSNRAIEGFVDAMIMHFPPFRWDEAEEGAWAATLTKELSGFDEAIINRARSEMVRTRKDRRTPLVSDCINACLEARRWIEAEKNKGQLAVSHEPTVTYFDWTNDRKKLALDLMRAPIGLQAAKGGWIGVLDEFCRKNARLPTEKEIPALQRTAKEVDAAYEDCVRGNGPWTPLAAACVAWGDAVMARRKELQIWREGLR
jgi:hypothetical protein